MKETKEISALLHLIDDPDSDVYTTVREKLISYGKNVIPNLEYLWETTDNPFIQERVEMLIHNVQYEEVKNQLNDWLKEGEPELLKGAYIFNNYHFPDVPYDNIAKPLENLRRNIWLELNPYLTPLEQTNIITGIIFQYYKFKKNPTDSNRPHDFLLSQVLETKKGNNISLTIIQLILARLAELPIHLIQIPDQLILAYIKYPSDNTFSGEPENIPFYIDGGSGQIFSYKEIELYLKRAGLEWSAEFFKPQTSQMIIATLIEEYASCFQNDHAAYKYNELKLLAEIIRG